MVGHHCRIDRCRYADPDPRGSAASRRINRGAADRLGGCRRKSCDFIAISQSDGIGSQGGNRQLDNAVIGLGHRDGITNGKPVSNPAPPAIATSDLIGTAINRIDIFQLRRSSAVGCTYRTFQQGDIDSSYWRFTRKKIALIEEQYRIGRFSNNVGIVVRATAADGDSIAGGKPICNPAPATAADGVSIAARCIEEIESRRAIEPSKDMLLNLNRRPSVLRHTGGNRGIPQNQYPTIERYFFDLVGTVVLSTGSTGDDNGIPSHKTISGPVTIGAGQGCWVRPVGSKSEGWAPSQ